ncbi:MAG: hypothetical protein ACTHLE_12810 [Agriterribacter sp.]
MDKKLEIIKPQRLLCLAKRFAQRRHCGEEKVMAGDKVSIFGESYYLNTDPINNSNSTVLDVITLMTNLLAVRGNPAGSKGLSAAQLNSTNSGLIPSSFSRGSTTRQAPPCQKPLSTIFSLMSSLNMRAAISAAWEAVER